MENEFCMGASGKPNDFMKKIVQNAQRFGYEVTVNNGGKYPIIKVPANGKPDWYEGARTWCFVYSRDNGNFILEGFRGEVEAYLKKNYTHYFCYWSLWSHGQSRGHWDFWKDYVGVFEPSKSRKDWKYMIRPYSNAYGHVTPKEEIEEKTLRFKRMPKHWIQEFNKL